MKRNLIQILMLEVLLAAPFLTKAQNGRSLDDIYKEIDRSAAATRKTLGYPEPSKKLKTLEYRCYQLSDKAACQEITAHYNAFKRAAQLETQRTQTRRRSY
jgi:hypothetical protein